MPQATREIKRRIRSVKNTRQITRAMELVSAAKMRKSVSNALASRSYAGLAWAMLQELSHRVDQSRHALLAKRELVKRIAVIHISSNRGLCGGFNNQLAFKVQTYLKNNNVNNQTDIEIITLGRRGRDIMHRSGFTITAEFTKPDITTKFEQVSPVARLVIDDYITGKYDRVVVAYTDFVSAISQKPKVRQILPILLDESQITDHRSNSFDYEYIFEPTPDAVLEELLPRFVEMQLYQAVLESDASEHSARMLAMRNASDAAKDMVDSLTLAFNQARQAGITAELSEITAGRVAVGG